MINKLRSKIILTFSLFFLIISLWSLPLISRAAEKVEIYSFYGQNCPHCAVQEKFLNDLKNQHPSLIIKSYEVYSNQVNRELLQALAQAYSKEVEGVPTLFIADQIFVGHSATIELAIRAEVERCLQNGCPSPIDKLDQSLIDVPNSDQAENQNTGWWILGTIGIVVVGFLIWTLKPKRKYKQLQ